VFLRQSADGQEDLALQVVFGASNLEVVAEAEGVLVNRSRDSSGWGPDLLDVRDPDGRIVTVREDVAGGERHKVFPE
jgi:hypothetical protein